MRGDRVSVVLDHLRPPQLALVNDEVGNITEGRMRGETYPVNASSLSFAAAGTKVPFTDLLRCIG
jgi:hypothetical protein